MKWREEVISMGTAVQESKTRGASTNTLFAPKNHNDLIIHSEFSPIPANSFKCSIKNRQKC
jgi:hypothetical protein